LFYQVILARVSVWCLCWWPFGAFIVLDCAVVVCCFSLFPPLLCFVLACVAELALFHVCAPLSILLAFLPLPSFPLRVSLLFVCFFCSTYSPVIGHIQSSDKV
jgi:hypothetical protein